MLGAGAFGIAMAVALGSGGHRVRLLVTSSRKTLEQLEEVARVINEEHVYPGPGKVADQLPPGYKFPENVKAHVHPATALKDVQYVVSAIPTQATYKALCKYKDLIPSASVAATCLCSGGCADHYVGPVAAALLAAAVLAAGGWSGGQSVNRSVG